MILIKTQYTDFVIPVFFWEWGFEKSLDIEINLAEESKDRGKAVVQAVK
jgi:hypothetical protein